MSLQRKTGAVILLIALLVFFLIIPIGIDQPGNIEHIALAPAFWPKIITVIIAGTGLLLVVGIGKDAPEDNIEASSHWRDRLPRLLIALGSLFLFYLLIPTLGMLVPGILVIFGLMYFAGERRWVVMSVISALVPIMLYIFFFHVANIPIPLGIFEALIY